tara:strand:+ start:777 stop:1025 length:249 start_codon:yes stop_codon:yes gene_type:complete
MSKFKVKFEVKSWDSDESHLTEQEFEADNLELLHDILSEGIENETIQPENNVPFIEGDFNVEYVLIHNENGEEIYRDDDYKG